MDIHLASALARRCTHPLLSSVLLLMLSCFSAQTLALPTHTLVHGKWSLISLPADPGSEGTVRNLFADDLPVASYGRDWMIRGYDSRRQLRLQPLDETLSANTAYWMMQRVASSVELDIPDNLKGVAGSSVAGCPDGKLCTSQRLRRSNLGLVWSMVGFSSSDEVKFGDTRFVSPNSTCESGCTPSQAFADRVVQGVLFRYNGAKRRSPYELVTESTALRPWDGYMLGVFPGSDPVQWVLPVGEAVEPSIDAARLLMQASFGPTEETIDEVLASGSAAQWIDAQIDLPATYHLPGVNNLYKSGVEPAPQMYRYQMFWQHARFAKDQLRQRVAFALSQIFVISDKATPVRDQGRLATAYYDLLIDGAFGNYRDLLENITLSPAMGVYLSMLGNEQQDAKSGRRADENYAREMLQLFSIGLVKLDTDGSELLTKKTGQPIPTYTQTDVENLARVFTGWSWNMDDWEPDSIILLANYPGTQARVTPMKAFPDKHDRGSKTFLEINIAADPSPDEKLDPNYPADGMNLVLNKVFNHENVGPFIGKQLIQRLVTSNPTPAYVERVATAFNDNGNRVRGDLAAVVRAILLDPEARSLESRENRDFGKLREPILRFAHMLRAFGPVGYRPADLDEKGEALNISQAIVNQLEQVVPLTAPSVFNFYTPDYAPPGEVSDNNLVAPEFQLNSETSVNADNRALFATLLMGRFKNLPVTINFDTERELYDLDNDETLGENQQLVNSEAFNPDPLIDHLDLVLTASSLSSESREILRDYYRGNKGQIKNENRVLIDLIGLVVLSTEFAIQR